MNDVIISRADVEPDKLSREYFFASFLDEAEHKNLLSTRAVDLIKLECVELLAEKIKLFTAGKSDSVPSETAAAIMKSNLYTIGVYLKTFSSTNEIISVLKEKSVSELYELGRKRIHILLKIAKHLHVLAYESMPKLKNITYSSTIVGGMKGFFKLYKADYFANEINITADYPVYVPISGYVGIEFIIKYLEAINCENCFCKNFAPAMIRRLLRGFAPDYENQVFSVFEQVFLTALACAVLNKSVSSIRLTERDIKKLEAAFTDKAPEELHVILSRAFTSLRNTLTFTNEKTNTYLLSAYACAEANIIAAAGQNHISYIFIKQT